MNWAQKIEMIGNEHADSIREIRYRIERVDREAQQNTADLGPGDTAEGSEDAPLGTGPTVNQ